MVLFLRIYKGLGDVWLSCCILVQMNAVANNGHCWWLNDRTTRDGSFYAEALAAKLDTEIDLRFFNRKPRSVFGNLNRTFEIQLFGYLKNSRNRIPGSFISGRSLRPQSPALCNASVWWPLVSADSAY